MIGKDFLEGSAKQISDQTRNLEAIDNASHAGEVTFSSTSGSPVKNFVGWRD
jgi:hypothetical protein